MKALPNTIGSLQMKLTVKLALKRDTLITFEVKSITIMRIFENITFMS